MERRGLNGVRLLSSDLDGTLTGDAASSRRFAEAWEALPQRTRPYLVYNSGRLIDDAIAHVAAEGLPSPDFLIGGVGTAIADAAGRSHFSDFAARLVAGWDRAKVEAIVAATPGIAPQPDRYQNEHKSSWFLHDAPAAAVADVSTRLAKVGLAVEVVYSSGRDLDVLPAAATKGKALAWLAAHLGLAHAAVVVAGDTGNDISMFCLPGVRGILVGNARPEMLTATAGLAVYRSPLLMAAGVMDGLAHYGVFAREVVPELTVTAMAPAAKSR